MVCQQGKFNLFKGVVAGIVGVYRRNGVGWLVNIIIFIMNFTFLFLGIYAG